MKRVLASIVGIVVIWGIAAAAQVAAFPVTVLEIQVNGNVEIRTREILEVVDLQPGDEIVEEDLKAASQAIFELGWFSEVIPKIDDEGTIVFNVVENPVLKKIEITGNINKEPFEIFGITLFRTRIMPSNRIRSILRDHDVKIGKVLNNRSLKEGLEALIDAYDKKGYTLIMVGNVVPEEVLQIELIEGRITDNILSGLVTVPHELAKELIDLPIGECLKKVRIQQVLIRLNASVYFSDVEITPRQGATHDSVELLWTLTERILIDEPIVIEKINLDGITVFSHQAAEETLGEIPSEPIDNYELLQIIEGLYDLYYQAGYAMARFSAEKTEAGQLRLHVAEGRIGEIALEGNTTTKDYVIMKNLELKEGDILNQERLAVAKQRLMALGYFESVNAVPEWDDSTIRLSVFIEENEKLAGINGSLAYSAQSGGLLGKLDYKQKNLFGTGQDLSFSYSRGLIGEESAKWAVSYTTVSFFPEFNRVGFETYRKSEKKAIGDEETRTFLTVGGSGSVSYPWADYTSLDLAYKHEVTQEVDSPIWQPIDSLTIAFSYDDVLHPRFPSEGSRRRISLEKAGGFSPGLEFSKVDLSWVHFSPIRIELPFFAERDQALALRLALGWGNRIPLSQAYDLGGPTTVRGTKSSPVRRRFFSNMEYRLAVIEGLTAVLFFDSGVNLDMVNPEGAKASFGLEFGVEVAGMYLRVDMAWVLGPEMGLIPSFDFGFSPMF